MAYTTEDLLLSVKRKALIPESQDTFEDSEILDIASEQIETKIFPEVCRARQDFYIVSELCTVTKGSSDKYGYLYIPKRASGMSILDMKDSNYSYLRDSDYFIEGNKIMFWDKADGTSIRVYYRLRPGKLVETTACMTSTSSASGVIGAATVPSTFTASETYDFVKVNPGFDTLAINISATSVGTSDITFTSTNVPSTFAVGDYVCLADESPVPQIPIEWFAYLSHLTAIAILESIGDYENAGKLEGKLPEMKANALSLIAPRVKNKSKAIVSSEYKKYRMNVSD